MKFIKISAFAIVLLLLMQIVSKAFIAIDSSDIENIYGFYAEPENSLDMVNDWTKRGIHGLCAGFWRGRSMALSRAIFQ